MSTACEHIPAVRVVLSGERVSHHGAVIATANDHVDFGVDGDHGDERYVEVNDGSGHFEDDFLVVLSIALVGGHDSHALVEHVRPARDRKYPQKRDAPRETDHREGARLGPLAQVLERRRDRPVAVQRQSQQIEDRGRARDIVGAQPDLTDGKSCVILIMRSI